jgi:hypothetical protein
VTGGQGGGELSRDELSATVAARHELGPEYDTALVDSLADRVEQVVQARVDAQLAQQRVPPPTVVTGPPPPSMSLSPGQRVAVAAVSLGVAIPCLAIAGDAAGVAGVVATWVGIVAVNVAAGISVGRGRP